MVGDRTREQASGVAPVLVVGSPGVGYEYLENLEALTVSDRRVALLTFAGSAAGGEQPAEPLLSVGACAAQLRAACDALGVPSVHLVAHGLGASVALALMRDHPSLVRSLALLSPFGAIDDLRPSAADALRARPAGGAAVLLQTPSLFARNACVADAVDAGGGPLLGSLLGGGGRLGGGRLGAALAASGSSAPVLLSSGGDADVVTPDWESLPPRVTRTVFGASGHLPFVDQRDDFLLARAATARPARARPPRHPPQKLAHPTQNPQALADFLDTVDGVATNRELKFASPGATLKELAANGQLAAPPKDCSAFKTDAARAYCRKSS